MAALSCTIHVHVSTFDMYCMEMIWLFSIIFAFKNDCLLFKLFQLCRLQMFKKQKGSTQPERLIL